MADAFYGSGLTNVTIAEGVTSISSFAFAYTSLTSVKCRPIRSPTSLKLRFRRCSHLANIVIPPGVTSIGDFAFSGCTNLASVTIPEGVTSIGEEAFDGCSNLSSIWLLGQCTRTDYYYTFYGANNAKVYYLPGATGWPSILPGLAVEDPFICVTNGGTSSIAGFSGSDLELTIPETITGLPVTAIGAGAFANSQLSR